jgi:hypothetical protein
LFQSLRHNPNGRFVVVCGDGEYIIYTALAWRNRSFGSALEFVWSTDGEYAIRESTSRIKIYSKNFQVCFNITYSPSPWYNVLFSYIYTAVGLSLTNTCRVPVPGNMLNITFIIVGFRVHMQ